jgi:vacuolar protein sorting-associated protein 45
MVDSCAGMKAFLFDADTMAIVSVVFSQSAMLAKEVFLFEQLTVLAARGDKRELMPHVKAIVFVRPTQEVLDLLVIGRRE